MLQTNSYQTENLRSLQFPLSDRGLISRNYSVLEVAPLNKPIGDDGYSPIELILLGVAEELSKLDGRNAYAKILCAKGSKVQNSIETVNAIGNWNGKNGRDKFNHLYENHFNTINNIPNIDIIHNHTYELTEYLSRHEINKPVVTTVHFSYETEDLKPFLKDNNYYVAISKSHKRELEKSGIPNARVVYNGIDITKFLFKTINKITFFL